MFRINKNKMSPNGRGYIALASMLVIGVVGLSVAMSLVLLGTGASRTSFALEQGYQAKALAGACAEEALQKILGEDVFVGTGSLNLGQGSCSYEVSGMVVPKTIIATGTVGTTVSRAQITIDGLHPYVRLVDWQEIAN